MARSEPRPAGETAPPAEGWARLPYGARAVLVLCALGAAGLAALGIASLLALQAAVAQSLPPLGVVMRAEAIEPAGRQPVEGQPLTLAVSVTNHRSTPVTWRWIEIDPALARGADLRRAEPPWRDVESVPRLVPGRGGAPEMRIASRYRFDLPIAPGRTARVLLRMVAGRPGTYPGVVEAGVADGVLEAEVTLTVAASQAADELEQGRVEQGGLLEEGEVTGIRDHSQPRIGNLARERPRGR